MNRNNPFQHEAYLRKPVDHRVVATTEIWMRLILDESILIVFVLVKLSLHMQQATICVKCQ
jgi:hypothetical protein